MALFPHIADGRGGEGRSRIVGTAIAVWSGWEGRLLAFHPEALPQRQNNRRDRPEPGVILLRVFDPYNCSNPNKSITEYVSSLINVGSGRMPSGSSNISTSCLGR